MGGGNRLAGEIVDLFSSSSSSSSSDDDDASSSDESTITELPLPDRCDACLSAYSRARALLSSRESIRRYKPGDFINDAARDEKFEIPETTTLLLVGGSGKSSLLSRIKSVFDDIWNPSAFDTARVLNDSSMVTDPCFLQEHMILNGSTSTCVFDTPGWSIFAEENYKILQKWMKNGVCHGDMDICDSVDANIKGNNNSSVPEECEFRVNKKRMVNYVILVVDAISILKSIDTRDTRYLDIVHATFNYPFLSFKGNKPAVVVTNGDQLSSTELSCVLNSVKDLLDIPLCHIFKISGIDNYHTELNILNLLRYCLEKADRGLPLKQKSPQKKKGLEHTICKADRYFDVVIDVCIAYLCLLMCFGLWRAMGLFPFGY